jgi:hypothetical protein
MTTPFSSVRLLLLASLVIAAASAEAACSSDTGSAPSASSTSSSGGESSGSPTISTADCTSRCAAKSSACGAPSESAQQACTQLCSEPRTEAQLTCLEGKDCGSLARTEDFDTLCPAGGAGSSTSSSSSSTSSSSSSGSSGTPTNNLPTTLTITGHFGTVKATHVKQDLTLVSFLSVAPPPTFSPSKPSTLPDLADKGITASITSPSPGACKARISYVLNSNQIGVMIEGTETLPATDCATFTDAVAKEGFKATLSNVPYPGGTPKATVTVDVAP